MNKKQLIVAWAIIFLLVIGSVEALQNGNYYANVRYSNFSTGYSGNYTLVVAVEYNSVTAIYFGNGGYVHRGFNNEGYTWSGGYLSGNSATVTLFYQNGSSAQFHINLQ